MAQPVLFSWVNAVIEESCSENYVRSQQTIEGEGGIAMKKLIVLVLVVLGLLAIMPAMEIDSSTQVFSRVGMAEGDGGG